MRKRVLVTAGANGIGLAIADRFAATGASVHICDIDGAALDAVLASRPFTGSIANVGDSAQVATLAAETLAALGGIDVVVNNAGIGGPRGAVETITDEVWDAVLRTNLSSMFYIVRELVPTMKAQRSGAIINISTTSVRTALPERSAYVVSKAAVEALTHNLARELGPFNIRCNSLRPGSIENERGRVLLEQRAAREGISYEAALEQRLGFISMRSRIDPSEVGDAAVFLASDNARHITGQCISVCGNVEWEG
ncbi:MAG: SDR family oxidoreductase [Sphingomonadales bacterium]|nr:MAG: SDR family oxidoreductase [Sphingomonadales bacterium]